jgi:hypothetical protein
MIFIWNLNLLFIGSKLFFFFFFDNVNDGAMPEKLYYAYKYIYGFRTT